MASRQRRIGSEKNSRQVTASSKKWGTCYFSVLAPGPTIFTLPPKAYRNEIRILERGAPLHSQSTPNNVSPKF